MMGLDHCPEAIKACKGGFGECTLVAALVAPMTHWSRVIGGC